MIFVLFFAEACTNYKLLTESWRRINGLGNKNKNNCDAPSRPGAKHIKPGDWYRFSGAAGTHLPTERLDSNAGARDVCGKKISTCYIYISSVLFFFKLLLRYRYCGVDARFPPNCL